MASRRTEQVADLLKEELSELLGRVVKDPRLGFVTLTDVRVTPDLRQARVFFSVLGDEAAAEQSLAALERAAGFLRCELGQRLTIRRVPELHFSLDRSIERSQRIADLLRQAEDQGKPPSGE